MFIVQDFMITATSPAAVDVGQSATSTITITGLNGFAGTVSLSDTVPPGLTCGPISPATVTGSGTATLSCSSTTPTNYVVTVTGMSGSLTHSTTATFSFVDFTVTASTPAAATVGSTETSMVTVTGINGFAGTVTLSDIVPSGLSCTAISPSSVTGSGSASLSCTSTTATNYVVSVTGTDGILTRTATTTFSFTDFTISANPTSITQLDVTAHNSTSITISPINGFTGTVTLTANPSAGLTATLSTSTITGGSGTAVLTVSSNAAGNYTVTVTGISGSDLQTTQTITVQVVDFQIFASPNMVSIIPGQLGNSTISVNPINGFSASIALSASISPSTGLTCTLNPVVIFPSQTSTLTCSGTGGTYIVTVTGTQFILQRTAMVTVNVQDFTITANPASITANICPSSGTSTITITSLGGFSGTVALTASTPTGSGISASLSPTSVTSSGSSTLTVTPSTTTVPGTYTVNVTGTSGSLTHSVSITVTVNSCVSGVPAPFFTQMTWDHRFSLSKFNDIQTWTFSVKNNGTSTIYFSVTITVSDGSFGTAVLTTPVFTAAHNKNVQGITLTETFNTAEIGTTFTFNAVINWGTTPSLGSTSTLTNGAPTSGSFTVLA
jgi:hypothetical protein